MRTRFLLVDGDYKSKVFNGLHFLRTIYDIEQKGRQMYGKKTGKEKKKKRKQFK